MSAIWALRSTYGSLRVSVVYYFFSPSRWSPLSACWHCLVMFNRLFVELVLDRGCCSFITALEKSILFVCNEQDLLRLRGTVSKKVIRQMYCIVGK